ncbi:hypothetical protein HZH68_005010 [Vespula germanica]|uniref:Uncharacterized protein n=1 Tax=Vespula germanica TaxID=30212 RepID=A0A834KGW3_VESGE|nr:hypothetical protein HZH68_005010 [Vespula germanica]
MGETQFSGVAFGLVHVPTSFRSVPVPLSIPPPFLYPHPFTPLASVTSLAPPFTPPTQHPTTLSMAGISFGHIGISDRMRWGGIDGIDEVEGWFIEGKTQANVIDLRIRGKLVRKLIQLRSMIPKDGRIEGRKRTAAVVTVPVAEAATAAAGVAEATAAALAAPAAPAAAVVNGHTVEIRTRFKTAL